MKKLHANPKREYPIVLTSSFEALGECILEVIHPSTITVVTDTHVAPLYLESVKEKLSAIAPIYTYIFEAGEKSKHLETVMHLYDTLIEHQVDRSGLIVALGGGVVGDLAGFVASSYMRGVPFIQIPTTIVAQNDSSIGGKVGVDYLNHKNMIGAFYQPKLVYTNISTLKTLPRREFISGLAEVLKHSLVKNPNFYDYLMENKDKILTQDEITLLEMTYESCRIKCSVVEEDAKESNLRRILNFGHTLGHALETVSDFSILHGECVAYGIVMAAYISYNRGMITLEVLEKVNKLISEYELLKPLPDFLDEEVLKHVLFDKKKAHGKVAFILLKAIGEVEIVQDVTEEEMKKALIYIKETC